MSENLGGGSLPGSFDNHDVSETVAKPALVQYFAVGQANETMSETDLKRESPPGHLFRPGTEVRYLRDEMRRISRLTNAGSMAEAREACAALMFDFQVIIVGRPHLAWQFAELLGRCGATGLSRRFQIATGFSSARAPQPVEPVDPPRPPQPVSADASRACVLAGGLD